MTATEADKKPAFVVLSGGGMKVPGLGGALAESLTHIKVVGIGGASAGAIVAALYAVGYRNPQELKDLLETAPYPSFGPMDCLGFAKLYKHKAISSNAGLRSWLEDMFARKGHRRGVTFGEINDVKLKVVATDLSQRTTRIYCQETYSDTSLARAVIASSSYPLFYPPHRDDATLLVDGGLLTNFPMWLFEKEEATQAAELLGMELLPPTAPPDTSEAFLSYLYALWETLMAAQSRVQERYIEPIYSSNVIKIPVGDVRTLCFKLPLAEIQLLYTKGKDAAREYFEKSRFGQTGRVLTNGKPKFAEAQAHLADLQLEQSLKMIVPHHVFYGGVAVTGGVDAPTRVKYYVDLTEASLDLNSRELLANILAKKIAELKLTDVNVVAGMKVGNSLLASHVATILEKPLILVRDRLSPRVGQFFDGTFNRGDTVVLIDDVSADANILLNAVGLLRSKGAKVGQIITLIHRKEGNSEEMLHMQGVSISRVMDLDDKAIHELLQNGRS